MEEEEKKKKKRLMIHEPVTGEFLLLAGTPSTAEQVRLSMKGYFESVKSHIWWMRNVKVYLSNFHTEVFSFFNIKMPFGYITNRCVGMFDMCD